MDYGCINVTDMHPYHLRRGGNETFDLSVPRHDLQGPLWETTTHTSHNVPCLSVLHVSKKFYQMTTEVFYGRNMFRIAEAAIVVPFLKDRGVQNLKLVRKDSIPCCSPIDLAMLREGHVVVENFGGDERAWQNAYRFLSIYLPNLKHVDLRLCNESEAGDLVLDRAVGRYSPSLGPKF